MCSGVVPQQPPSMLTRPSSAKSLTLSANISGVSSYPPIALGRPALGYEWTKQSAHAESACMNGSICCAPSAQLRPMHRGLEWATDT